MERADETRSVGGIKALASFDVLFARPGVDGRVVLPDSRIVHLLSFLLKAFAGKCGADSAGAAECLNDLIRSAPGGEFAGKFTGELFRAFISLRVLPADLCAAERSCDAEFLLRHLLNVTEYLKNIPSMLTESEKENILPGALSLFESLPSGANGREEAVKMLLGGDPFAVERVFVFRDGKFFPVRPDSVKPVAKFFGFPGVRAAFADQFALFASGKSNLPLLINSLPGYGKTSMTVSYAMAEKDLVTILAEPEALEKNWTELTGELALRRDHRFVIFFDDIDPRKIDWYSFRTNVGGAFLPPENVMPVITANYEFPASILSRGRKITYPVFDELRCTEIVEDFLKSFGMRHPPANLVSLIAADYTEEFGQKRFTELSPRTLMRYLKIYEVDPVKRRTMVELASGEMVQKPDAELFYEFNIELMRSLYGEEYIKRLLKERLKEL